MDIGHCIQNSETTGQTDPRMLAVTKDIHLHDAIASGAGHLALGSGDLPLRRMLAHLIKSDSRGYLTLETLGTRDTLHSFELAKKTIESIEDEIRSNKAA